MHNRKKRWLSKALIGIMCIQMLGWFPTEVAHAQMSNYEKTYTNGVYIREKEGDYISIESSVSKWFAISGSGIIYSSTANTAGMAVTASVQVENAVEGDVLYLNSGKSILYQDDSGTPLTRAAIFQSNTWVDYTGDLPAPVSEPYEPINQPLIMSLDPAYNNEDQLKININSKVFIQDYEEKLVEASMFVGSYLQVSGAVKGSVEASLTSSDLGPQTSITLNFSNTQSGAMVSLSSPPAFYVNDLGETVPLILNVIFENDKWLLEGANPVPEPTYYVHYETLTVGGIVKPTIKFTVYSAEPQMPTPAAVYVDFTIVNQTPQNNESYHVVSSGGIISTYSQSVSGEERQTDAEGVFSFNIMASDWSSIDYNDGFDITFRKSSGGTAIGNTYSFRQTAGLTSVTVNGRTAVLTPISGYDGYVEIPAGTQVSSVNIVAGANTTYSAIWPSSIPGVLQLTVSTIVMEGPHGVSIPMTKTYSILVRAISVTPPVISDDSNDNSNTTSNTSTPTITPPPVIVSAVNNALNQITAQLNPDAALDGTGNVADSVFKANEDFLDKLKEISPDKIIESVDKIQDQLIKNKEIFEKAQTTEDKNLISRQMLNVIEESLKKSGTLESKPADKMIDDVLVQMAAPKKTEIEKAIKNLDAMDAALKKTVTDTLGEREAANVKKKLTVAVEPAQAGAAPQPSAGVELTQDITKFIQESQVQQLDIDLGSMSYGIPSGELNSEVNNSTFLASVSGISVEILSEEPRTLIANPLELSYLEDGKRVDEFQNPVTLSFDLNEYIDDISKLNPDDFVVLRLDEENKLLESVGGNLNLDTGEIVLFRQHLSTYTVAKSNKSFSDVNDSWAKSEINAMLNKGIIKDTGKGFQPTAKMTREELVSWISKTYGLKEKDITLSFTDVDKKSPYYKEIAAAYDLGIISGKDGKTFDPKAAVTRQEVATVVMRAKTKFEAENMVKEIEKSLASNADKDKVADWAKSSVATATEKGILTASAGNINPTAEVSKEEAANMIYKAYYKQ